ncbi:MAG: hypothetical protein MJ201_04920 [Mycoplasmoidaceae bacterium]|nr:hypothetical protein [Mycoplasmoidaceae bacterium]
MKKIKFITLVPSVALATIIPVCACSQKNKTQDIVDAIFGPLDIKRKKIINSFEEELKKLSPEELNNELIYDLFSLSPLTVIDAYNFITMMKDLYEKEIIGIQTKITKESLSFDKEGDLIATFLGYVSFVFLKDYTSGEKKYLVNDYCMLTFDMVNLYVRIDEPSCSLIYEDNFSGHSAIGFMKIRMEGGAQEHMISINEIDISDKLDIDIPTNSKN